MNQARFLRGVGLGLAVGAVTATAMAMKPKKKNMKSSAEKALKAMGDAVETISEHMGM